MWSVICIPFINRSKQPHYSGVSFSAQITWTAHSTSSHVRLTDATEAQESVVSYLPLSHIAAQMVDIWVTMKAGGATYFAQPDALKVASVVLCETCT